MLARPQVWGAAVAAIGAPSVLAGIGILAADPAQMNHNFGWGLLLFGVAVTVVCGARALSLSLREPAEKRAIARADHGSVSIVGDKNVTINMPQGGSTVDTTEKVEPNVVLDGFAPVRDQPITAPRLNQPTKAEFARVQFVNECERRGPNANVADLHAAIEVRDIAGEQVILIVADGRWAENVDRGMAPGRDTKSVPLPCSGETRTLDIVMRPYGDNNCYGWSHSGFQIPEPTIPTGEYEVNVELDASNMEKRHFRFILSNPLGADKGGVVEDSWIELREADGFANPCSARWASQRDKKVSGAEKERIRRSIAAIDPLIGEAQEILEACGRPHEQMRGADPMYFQRACIPRINRFAHDAITTIQEVAPEYMGRFQNIGNVFRGTDDKPVMIQQVEKWVENLGRIQDELRRRL